MGGTFADNLGGIPPLIYGDLGGNDRWYVDANSWMSQKMLMRDRVWFVLANLLALAAVCPFVGAISDLIGRRYVALLGASLIVIGMIVSSTAHSMNIFIGMQIFLNEPIVTLSHSS